MRADGRYQDWVDNYQDAEPVHDFSPRIGISYPITDRGVIHFSYGHFSQIPTFEQLYDNSEFEVWPGLRSTMGNGNLRPQRTVIYEIGLQQQLSENIGVDVTGFYKDMRHLLGMEILTTYTQDRYARFINRDYGNVRGITLANRHYLSYGITSLQEATVSNELGRWQILRQLKDAGKLKSRVSMMFGIDALSQFQEAGLAAGSGDSQLRLGGIKIMVNKAAGQLQPPQLQLNQQAFNAHQAGFQLAIHATKPSTLEAAIIALEYAHSRLPQTGRRHRIEHCSVCSPHLLKRLSRLKATIVTQPPFLYYSG